MAYFSNESTIIAKPYVFDEGYIPPQIIGREKHIEQIRGCLEPVRRQLKPLHCWTYGPSGSGKTSLIQSLLAEAEQAHGLRWAYLNCWETPTYYALLDRLVRQLRVLGGQSQLANVKVEAIAKSLANRPFVVALDELDAAPTKERALILYNLSQLAKVGLICISYHHRALTEMDARIRSRLNPLVIPMHPYDQAEILAVLVQRAESGLMSGAWTNEALEKIVDLAEGNSRTAVQTLRNAVFLVERKRERQLTAAHVDECWTGSGDLRKRHLLGTLTPHHRLLCEIVESQGYVASGDLWNRYQEQCVARSVQPVALRTYNHYLGKLVALRLLIEEIVIDKGRRRGFRAPPSTKQG